MLTIETRSAFSAITPGTQSVLVAHYATGYPYAPALYVPGSSSGPLAIQDSGGNWFQVSLDDGANVLWFGAARNGSTDDQSAIQSAINAIDAVGGGVVHVPAGNYAIKSAINLKSNVKLQGNGFGTVLTHASASGFNMLTAYQKSGCIVADMTLDGNSFQGVDGLVFNQSSRCIGQRVYCKNWWGYHFWMINSTESTFAECVADTVRDNGFEVLGSDHCTVINCKAINVTSQGFNLWAGTKSSSCVGCIAQLTTDSSYNAIGFHVSTDHVVGSIADDAAQDIIISGCSSTGGRYGVVIFGLDTTPYDDDPTKIVSRVVVAGCTFQDYAYYGIAMANGVEQITISDCIFNGASGCYDAVSLQMAPGTARNIIVKGNQALSGSWFLRAYGIDHLMIANNILRQIVPTGQSGIQTANILLRDCEGANILGNQIVDPGTSTYTAIGIYLATSSGGCVDCLVANNSIIDTRTGSARGLNTGIIDNGTNDLVTDNITRNSIN